MAADVFQDLQIYLNGLPAVCSELLRNLRSDENEKLQKMSRLAEEQIVILFWYLTFIEISEDRDPHLINLISVNSQDKEIGDTLSELIEIYQSYHDKYSEFLACKSKTPYKSAVASCEEGNSGRPRFIVDADHLQGLRDLGFSWTKISTLLGVSRSTIVRRRREFHLDERPRFSDITDQELDAMVTSILELCHNSGEVMVQGALLGRGVKVQRRRLRESLTRVDPIGREIRRRYTIKRRVYNVPAPNALWHMDGNHKLVRWRLVIHGAIDGYSRVIAFLNCSSNNKAETVLQLFLESIQKFGCPERIRSDHGTENIGVARFMLEEKGTSQNPFITGRSVHNQRIERLWRDLSQCAISYYRSLFYYLESEDMLDPSNEIHLFGLHYVFLARINRSINQFVTQWNNHPLSSEHSNTPLQLWINGVHHLYNSARDGIASFLNPESYGIDYDAPLPQIQTSNTVEIPESSVILKEEDEAILQLLIHPLSDDGNHGIEHYKHTINLLNQFIDDPSNL